MNDNHDETGRFTTGSGSAGSGADHKKIRETVATAMEEREGDRSNSAHLRAQKVEKQARSAERMATTRANQAAPGAADDWNAAKQRAKDFMSGKTSAKDYTKR